MDFVLVPGRAQIEVARYLTQKRISTTTTDTDQVPVEQGTETIGQRDSQDQDQGQVSMILHVRHIIWVVVSDIIVVDLYLG